MKFSNTKLIITLIGIIGAATLYWHYGPQSAKDNNELVVGIIAGYVPFAMLNETGEVEGFDIDVAKAVAQKLNKKLVFQDMSLSALLIALQQNKLDLVLTSLSITPERQEKMALIHYQGEPTTTFPLVFWEKIPQGITSIEDLQQRTNTTICVEPGSVQEKFLLQFSSLIVCQVSAMSEIVMNLKYGKAQAALLDPDIYPTLKKQTPQLVKINVPLPKRYQTMGVGIGINKSNTNLIEQVSAIIANLKRDGTLKKLEQRWFTQ